jgi:hypothetical protein
MSCDMHRDQDGPLRSLESFTRQTGSWTHIYGPRPWKRPATIPIARQRLWLG